jgi:hypothetical protein
MVKYHRNVIWTETNDVIHSHRKNMGFASQKLHFENEPNKLKNTNYWTDHLKTHKPYDFT